jgi:hypothetical protein
MSYNAQAWTIADHTSGRAAEPADRITGTTSMQPVRVLLQSLGRFGYVPTSWIVVSRYLEKSRIAAESMMHFLPDRCGFILELFRVRCPRWVHANNRVRWRPRG